MKEFGELSKPDGLTQWKDNMKWEYVKKPEVEWTVDEDGLANHNSKALNSIFNAVDANQFKLISTYKIAKDAWQILETRLYLCCKII